MSSLPAPLRRQLERTICDARKIAEAGAAKALRGLAVHEPDPYRHMDDAQRRLRRRLRAQARQLGDGESRTQPGAYEIRHLVEKLAYDQWHRILFARYLLENDLLMSPEHGVSVSLEDCEELAPSLGLKDSWTVAARFAAKELPEIFRDDDPAGAVELPVEDRNPLLQLVTGLPVEVFTASDSLGWCYQFWQAERKDQVNAAGNKIGADEISPVTQLFTEDYMVDFLLDNTLGAWWAGTKAKDEGRRMNYETEAEARAAVALPDCEWKYLRFIQADSSSMPSVSSVSSVVNQARWTPAAGTFDGWPKIAAALKCLDPCMGSGHFVVAMFQRLVALRMAEENLSEADAVAAVIRDNLFGLELDPRCTQIAAFNLALAAWRRVGHCKLPAMNLACSGLAPNTSKDSWVNLAALLIDDSPLVGERDLLGPRGEPMLLDARLAAGMARLYDLFQKAPVLGSLINPRAGEGDLLVAAFHELQPLLEKALAQETKDDTAHEMAVTARGLAKAAEILAGQFTLVATNVPYLGRPKQDDVLADYCEKYYPDSKADLATCFLERCLDYCAGEGNACLVTPQNWLFLGRYKDLREKVLTTASWNSVARLGVKAFQTPMWDFNIVLLCIGRAQPTKTHVFFGIDVGNKTSAEEKGAHICLSNVHIVNQSIQMNNPDAAITFEEASDVTLLSKFGNAWQGIATSDIPRFQRGFWEVPIIHDGWHLLQSTVDGVQLYGGRESAIYWQNGYGAITEVCQEGATFRGKTAWGQQGVVISQMSKLAPTLYSGDKFDCNCAVITLKEPSSIPALWCYVESGEYLREVRRINQKLNVTNSTLAKVPFDLAHWQKVAAEKYPDGLPKPFSSDPTQWLFNGHPAGADQPLHVAVARLLGYQWPRQTGSSFPDCPALSSDGLETFADTDGIVCLSATKGEPPAAERLRTLLAQALGTFDLKQLLTTAGPKGSKSQTLDEWLRDEFFDQHCALFHHRPFLWHIWDGLKNGFSALVNYHKLTHANLEKLTFAYLGDWIRRQQAAVEAGEAGSDAKLQAAKELQIRLKLILEGEPPYDLFVRWKPLAQQAIGWHPDLNDGVRMNIRPFLATDIPGGKKGAGLLRAKPNIKWEKDRGKEPQRTKEDYPWFWQGSTFTGDRLNDIHLTHEQKKKALR
jgi:hypothetical protein